MVAKIKCSSEEERLAIFQLVAGDANLEETYGDRGKTIFIDAARYGRIEIVRYLIDRKVNVLAKDVRGNTALHRVAGRLAEQPGDINKSLLQIAGAIIEAKPEALKAENDALKTPESIAPVVATCRPIQRPIQQFNAGLFLGDR